MDIEEAQSASIFRDLIEIFAHEFQRFIKFVWKDHLFLSNDEIVHRLSARVGDSPYDKVLQKYNQITLVGMTQIKPKPGIVMDAVDMHKILKQYFPELVVSVQTKEELYVHPILRGIMTRYGEAPVLKPPAAKRAEACQLFMKRMKLESMRLSLADRLCTQRKASSCRLSCEESDPNLRNFNVTSTFPDESRNNSSEQSDFAASGSFLLSVEIKSMRNLPKMDLFRGVDAFCYIFFESAPGLFQTEIRRGLSEADWTWEPELSRPFQWALTEDSELLVPERKVVVMVYDKDQVSSDDLIGCVTVSLGELENGVFDGWRRIIRPPDAWRTKYHFWMPPVAELLLRVTLLPRQGPLEHNDSMDSKQFDESFSVSPQLGQSSSLRAPASKFTAVSQLSYPLQVQSLSQDPLYPPQHQNNSHLTTREARKQSRAKSSHCKGPHDSCCFGCVSTEQVLILGTIPQRSTLEVQIEDGSGSSINYC